MQISENSRNVIVNEFAYVIKKMRGEKDPSKKLYYFSAAYGVIFRILNLEFDSTLNVIHFVLNGTYSSINNRLNIMGQGIEMGVGIPTELFTELENTTEAIARAIEEDADPLESLEKLAVLSYVTSGNGYYLYEKGLLKLR